MKDIDLDAVFAMVHPPLVVHRGIVCKTETPCGLPLVRGAWGPITSMNARRVNCPDCTDKAAT